MPDENGDLTDDELMTLSDAELERHMAKMDQEIESLSRQHEEWRRTAFRRDLYRNDRDSLLRFLRHSRECRIPILASKIECLIEHNTASIRNKQRRLVALRLEYYRGQTVGSA